MGEDMQDVALEKVEAVTEPIINNLGYRLVDCEFTSEPGRFTLRIFIDKDDGAVMMDDCELVSRAVEDVIEAEGIVGMAYNLEVSSPGLDRPLKKKEDFERYRGREIKLKTREPIEGRSNYKGILENFKDDQICMIVDGMKFEIPLNQVSKARLVPDIRWSKGEPK